MALLKRNKIGISLSMKAAFNMGASGKNAIYRLYDK
jgi:hypothetical protein